MLKIIITSLLCLCLAPAWAGNQGSFNEADLQKMMEQAKNMQACTENIDKGQLKALETKGRQIQADVRALCKSDQRDKAQSTAIAFAMSMSDEPALKSMRKCMEMMPEMMSGIISKMPYEDLANNTSQKHICD